MLLSHLPLSKARYPLTALNAALGLLALGGCGDPEAAKAAKQIEECKLAMLRAGEPYKDDKTRNSKEAVARTVCMNKFK